MYLHWGLGIGDWGLGPIPIEQNVNTLFKFLNNLIINIFLDIYL